MSHPERDNLLLVTLTWMEDGGREWTCCHLAVHWIKSLVRTEQHMEKSSTHELTHEDSGPRWSWATRTLTHQDPDTNTGTLTHRDPDTNSRTLTHSALTLTQGPWPQGSSPWPIGTLTWTHSDYDPNSRGLWPSMLQATAASSSGFCSHDNPPPALWFSDVKQQSLCSSPPGRSTASRKQKTELTSEKDQSSSRRRHVNSISEPRIEPNITAEL